MRTPRSQQMLQDSLGHVRDLLERHRVLEQLTRSQDVPNRELLEVLQRRQNVAELHHKLRVLHPADLAHILEALPMDERLAVWREVEPVKAGDVLGGNTGNQTVALLVRALALDQVTASNVRHLVAKELGVGLVNGVMWGAVMGTFALLLYRSSALGLVMAAAILLNLLVAAVVGLAVPFFLHRSGRDPAQGASVLLTFTTDGMGFFIFLGLARIFLV